MKSKLYKLYTLSTAAMLVLTTFINSSLAQDKAPGYIPVQGYLNDAAGDPLDGTFDGTFSIYDSLDETAVPLLSELQSVEVRNGFFTVYIGDKTSGAVDLIHFRNHQYLFVGIKVGTDAEATPRIQLGTAPYAAFAQFAADCFTVGGIKSGDLQRRVVESCSGAGSYVKEIAADGKVVCGNSLADGIVSTAQIIDGTVTSAKIADGSIVGGKLAAGSITTDHIADGTISSADIGARSITADRIKQDQILMSCNTVTNMAGPFSILSSFNVAAYCPTNTVASGGGCSATVTNVVSWSGFRPIVSGNNSSYLCEGFNTSTASAVNVTSFAQCCRIVY